MSVSESSLLERVLSRDRLIILAALAVLAVLAWAYLLTLGGDMPPPAHGGAMPDMSGMDMSAPGAAAPMVAPWSRLHFLLMFLMWSVMMVGMMTPAVAPMALLYARIGRMSEPGGRAVAPALWFVLGYFLSWTVFSLAATGAQWALDQASALTPMLKLAAPKLGGAFLIAAGLYEISSIKATCLRHCRSPMQVIARHGGFKLSRVHSARVGLLHGLYCISCCWALMGLLFVGGVMNAIWIAGLAGLVLVEQVTPWGPAIARYAGAALIALGVFVASGVWSL